ncbi:MAG: MliC family protein [Rickettsiales bacterium]|jgi:membrane-bound inhibitor of C-type lysozyme|nr:MliC family protein [Rickettsiales bacterium]
MKKLLIVGACILTLGACEKSEPPISTTEIICGAQPIQINVYNDYITANIGGKKIKLSQAESASGARYVHAETGDAFWNKGSDWMMVSSDGKQTMGCKTK